MAGRAADRVAAGTSSVGIEGGTLEYLDVPGDPGRAPLVFLHEGLGSVGLWRGFPARVAERTGRRAVAFSRFGHGASDPPPVPRDTTFMTAEADTVLPQVRERLGLERPLLVSHSDGATIALLHAAAFDDVTAVVAMAPHVVVEEIAVRAITEAREQYRHGGLRERMARHHHDPDVTFAGWNDVWLSPAFRSWDVTADVAPLACPLLLIQGAADQYGTLAQLDAVEGAVAGPTERLVLDCAHSPHLEAPEATLEAVVEFAARQP